MTNYTNEPDRCSVCGNMLQYGDRYFLVNGRNYCMACSEYAEEEILDDVRDEYIREY